MWIVCNVSVDCGINISVRGFVSVDGDRPVTEFEDAYRTHRRDVVQLAWLLTHDAVVAEDVAQDVFVSLYEAFGRVENPAAYLRRCVINRVYQLTRTSQRERRRNALVTASDPQLDTGPTGGIADVIAKLPIDQRTAVVLRYWGGLRDREIAEAMGIRPGTARSHLSRATAHLRKELL
jgi:DNA-directed RNA polymerase specialized sigma24 family protein